MNVWCAQSNALATPSVLLRSAPTSGSRHASCAFCQRPGASLAAAGMWSAPVPSGLAHPLVQLRQNSNSEAHAAPPPLKKQLQPSAA